MPMTDTQMQETLRRYRTEPQSFSDEQQAELAQNQGRLLAAVAVGNAQTVRQQAVKAKEAASQAEQQAHDALDRMLAELETREGMLAADDGVGKAEVALERARAVVRYRPLATALEQAQDTADRAGLDVKAAEIEEARWT